MKSLVATLLLLLSACAGADTSDPAQIRALIAHTYDKPLAKVETRPIAVSGNYAVASWRQGERGGRVLLFKQEGEWSVQLCSGSALRTVDGLVASRVPRSVAESLAQHIVAAESSLSPAERARFDSFGEQMTRP